MVGDFYTPALATDHLQYPKTIQKKKNEKNNSTANGMARVIPVISN